jgi:hypothetical protein
MQPEEMIIIIVTPENLPLTFDEEKCVLFLQLSVHATQRRYLYLKYVRVMRIIQCD